MTTHISMVKFLSRDRERSAESLVSLGGGVRGRNSKGVLLGQTDCVTN